MIKPTTCQLRLVLAPCLLVLFLAACERPGIPGNGVLSEEARSIEAFSDLSIKGSFQVAVELGQEPGLELRGEENLLPLIRTRIQGGRLIIDTVEKIAPTETIEVRITGGGLTSIDSEGANSIEISSIEGDLLEVGLSGAGSMYLIGRVGRFELDVQGAGSVSAEALEAQQVDVALVGAASARVFASESLKASVTGVGTIDYFGSPSDVDTNVTGIGTISRKDGN